MRKSSKRGAGIVLSFLFATNAHAAAERSQDESALHELVAVSIVRGGGAILLATPGVPAKGRSWRFRSLDTSALPQPIRSVSLSSSGTKLFIQFGDGPGGVLDLTRQYRHHVPLQRITLGDLAIDGRTPPRSHRLPGQRFMSLHNGTAYVVDDEGRRLSEYRGMPALRSSIDDGDASSGGWTEASLRAYLAVNGPAVPEERIAAHAVALVKESAKTWAAEDQPLADWQFFHISVDAALYAPVLELSRLETVFPATFDTLERLKPDVARRGQPQVDRLYNRYLSEGVAAHRAACNFYVTTRSIAGSWLLEYWLYYPFDVGGLGSHPHDPEHIFVEVDKLGGTVHRVVGAGHGYMAGNNMFTAGHAGAALLQLPLFVIVELGKHASAPDVDRDGVFTPGIDENTYNERAKVWGSRDVIGTMHNETKAFDASMSGVRRPEDFLTAAELGTRYPDDGAVVAAAHCQLTPLPGPPAAAARPCDDFTADCARLHVTSHPDYRDPRAILKEWNFPKSFLRASYGLGPRKGLYTVGLGYAMDMELLPGIRHALPLPGRLGADVFFWQQPTNAAGAAASPRMDDRDSCPGRRFADGLPYCPVENGVGWAIRYEQFLSNLFGVYSSVRVFSPPVGDAWITFGPFVETSLGGRANVMLQGGLSFRPYESPRFEMRLSIGVWKPKSHRIGIEAAGDHGR